MFSFYLFAIPWMACVLWGLIALRLRKSRTTGILLLVVPTVAFASSVANEVLFLSSSPSLRDEWLVGLDLCVSLVGMIAGAAISYYILQRVVRQPQTNRR
jgi:hypothetical protein